MRLIRPSHALLAFAALALSSAASAHTGAPGHEHGGFMAGLLHPLTGLDHLAAMVAIGLWSALSVPAGSQFPARVLWSPAWFAALLLGGAVLGWSGLELPGVEPMIAVSLLVTGLLVATRLALPRAVSALVAGSFAVFHGLAHGAELPAAQAAATLAGMLLATLALHGAGVLAGWPLRRHVWAPRLAGGAVSLLGGVALWPALV
ncbi:MAG: HupE/UreJ family protein [Burkholderiaceae bacterium]